MGKSHSIEALLEHSQWVRGLARALVGTADADDLVQDTFEVALRRPVATTSPRAWLGAVARRLVQNRQRAQRHRGDREHLAAAERLEAATTMGAFSPESVVERSEIQRAVVDAVHGLPEPYRGVLLMRYFDGLSPAEIAKVRALKPATVRTHLARGRALVREALDARSGGDQSEWVLALTPLLGARRKVAVASAVSAAAPFFFWKVAACAVALIAFFGWWKFSPPALVPAPGANEHRIAIAGGDEETAVAPLEAPVAESARKLSGPETEAVSAPVEELAVSTGTLLVLDGRTKRPLPNFRFEESVRNERDARFGRTPKLGVRECYETDHEGRVTLPLLMQRIAPHRRFECSNRFDELLGRGGRSYDDPIAVEWVHGVATIEALSYATVPVELNLPSDLLATDLLGSVTTTGGPLWVNRQSELRRGHSGYFLRFEDDFAAHANDLEMCLFSADGTRVARVPYAPYREGERTWDVEWQLRGSLRVRIQRDGAAVTDWPASLQLWPGAAHLDAQGHVLQADGRGGTPRTERRLLRRRVERGLFELIALVPGTYTVTLHDRSSKPWSKIVKVAAGQIQDLTVQLHSTLDELGTVRGRVTSASGSFNGPVLAYAHDLRPHRRAQQLPPFARVVWGTVEGQQVGTFELKDVALDAHSIGFYRSGDVYDQAPMGQLLPRRTYQAQRGETLHIHLEDQIAEVSIEVMARDAKTKEKIDWFQVQASRPELSARGLAAHFVMGDAYDGLARLKALTVPDAYGVHVEARGYQMLTLQPGALQGLTELTVELQPGWSAALSAFDSAHNGMVEGVEFFVDGVSVGSTLGTPDEKRMWSDELFFGMVPIVRLDTAPQRIEARKEGWVMTTGGPTDEEGNLSSFAATTGGQLIWTMEKAPVASAPTPGKQGP